MSFFLDQELWPLFAGGGLLASAACAVVSVAQSAHKKKEDSIRICLLSSEDWWAVVLGFSIVAFCLFDVSFGKGFFSTLAVRPPEWHTFTELNEHLTGSWFMYLALWAFCVACCSLTMHVLYGETTKFACGFTVIFSGAILIGFLSSSHIAKTLQLEDPIVALVLGLLCSNLMQLPRWIEAGVKTEFYIKIGIVLMGATLPIRLIVTAGPIACFQATIVSVTTFAIIFLAATSLFEQGERFSALLGVAGSVCGVSAAVAVGSAVRAPKEEVAVASSVVMLWAMVMIFALPAASAFLGLPPGQAGAWIGNCEFADAAGLAAAAAVPAQNDAAVQAFTLMKVIGRDIWIGIWCIALTAVSLTRWEPLLPKSKASDDGVIRREAPGRVPSFHIFWERFPKFFFGFVAACVAVAMAGQTGQAIQGTLKAFRTWFFMMAFFCIGLTTRVRELLGAGKGPFLAFTCGVFINVPLGYFLSTSVFGDHWSKLDSMDASLKA